MPTWLPLALLAALGLALYNVFLKLAAGHLPPAVGAVVLQLVAAALGGAWLLRLKLLGPPLPPVSGRGLGLAALAGLGVGVAEILAFTVFGRGVPAAVGTPVVVGGSVLLTALLGLAVLRESQSVPQVGGLVLIVAGIALLARGQ